MRACTQTILIFALLVSSAPLFAANVPEKNARVKIT